MYIMYWWPTLGSFPTSPGEPHASAPPDASPIGTAPTIADISKVWTEAGSAAKSTTS